MIKASVIILAAGQSQRAGTDKQFYKLGNKYLIQHTIEKFKSSQYINEIILVLSENNLKKYSQLFNGIKLTIGGKTRIESMINGSKQLSNKIDVVLVHDGARPFVSTNLVKKIVNISYKYGCAIPVIPVKDTIKEIDTKTSIVIKTLDRKRYFAVQTPQGYTLDNFKKIIKSTPLDDLTDDSQIAERIGIKVHTINGEETNIKITTPLDLVLAGVLYEKHKTTI